MRSVGRRSKCILQAPGFIRRSAVFPLLPAELSPSIPRGSRRYPRLPLLHRHHQRVPGAWLSVLHAGLIVPRQWLIGLLILQGSRLRREEAMRQAGHGAALGAQPSDPGVASARAWSFDTLYSLMFWVIVLENSDTLPGKNPISVFKVCTVKKKMIFFLYH